MCHYHQVEATTHWQLLAQVPNRCGLLVPLKTIYAAFGKRVDVPEAPPGAAVIASFAGVGSSLLYRLENVVLKARPVQMLTNDGDFRFIAATADDLHLLRPPASLGYGAAYSPVAIRWFSLHEKDLLSDRGHFPSFLPAPRRRTALGLGRQPRTPEHCVPELRPRHAPGRRLSRTRAGTLEVGGAGMPVLQSSGAPVRGCPALGAGRLRPRRWP